MLLALTFYTVLGGADFGGGVWDLLARGRRKGEQRALIASAIGPVWEANHVWLILVVVILFTGFPAAFARICILLHVPILLILIGIVLRGSAFTFRSYGYTDRGQRYWGRIFAVASLVTPVALGVVVGALSSGKLSLDAAGGVGQYFEWVDFFNLAVGFFALSLFALIAAVFLAVEGSQGILCEDFRTWAYWSQGASGALAFVVLLNSRSGAPLLWQHLVRSWWAWPLQLATAFAACAVCILLYRRHWRLAQMAVVIQICLILWGWSAAEYPFLVAPDISISNAASSASTLHFLLVALCSGALLLFPSLLYLLRVFKRSHQEAERIPSVTG